MRLIKKPKSTTKEQEKAVITPKKCPDAIEVKDNKYQIQTIDGFVQKIKLCIGKPDHSFQKTKLIFSSKIRGVRLDVYANVCKTPASTRVVGVRIVEPKLQKELEIMGSNFTKEDGIEYFIDKCHNDLVGACLLQEVPK